MQLLGRIGVGQQCLIPAEVLPTPTRSKGQLIPAKTDGITRARGLESLTTILALVVHPIRFGTWQTKSQSSLGQIPTKIPRTTPLQGLPRRLLVRLRPYGLNFRIGKARKRFVSPFRRQEIL